MTAAAFAVPLALLLAAAGAADPDAEYISAFPVDDACLAGDSTTDCALNALQRRSHTVREVSEAGSKTELDAIAALRDAAQLGSEVDLDMAAAVWEAVRLNASAGVATVSTSFGAGAEGTMTLARLSVGVLFGTGGLSIDTALISAVCGEVVDNSTPPTFPFHIHEKFESANGLPYGAGAECGPDITGGHWDPTAACGHASGNAACGACGESGKKPYACSPQTFKWWRANQYNPSNKHACELGDLSGMFGPLEAWELPTSGRLILKGKIGLAQLSAARGVVSVKHKWHPCRPRGAGFVHGRWRLRALRGKSVVLHCGSAFEHSGARLICAKLPP